MVDGPLANCLCALSDVAHRARSVAKRRKYDCCVAFAAGPPGAAPREAPAELPAHSHLLVVLLRSGADEADLQKFAECIVSDTLLCSESRMAPTVQVWKHHHRNRQSQMSPRSRVHRGACRKLTFRRLSSPCPMCAVRRRRCCAGWRRFSGTEEGIHGLLLCKQLIRRDRPKGAWDPRNVIFNDRNA